MALDKRKLSKAVKDKYSFANETFFHTAKAHLKDRIEVEIGDSKQPDFKPQVKVQRWDNEVNLSFRLKDDGAEVETVDTVADKIVWKKGKREAHFYDIKNAEHPEGAYEFEVFLLEKPATNVVEFSLNTKGLDFFYQPALTPEEIAEGASRPENVVGSYAVYASEKKTNWVGGKEYKCGKVGHIYRPQIEDANGTKVWGELNVDTVSGILSVTISQEFLDNAVYPVRHAAGLTFGYTTLGASAGGSATSNASAFGSFLNTTASDTGTVSSISAGLISGTTWKGFIVNASTLAILTNGITSAHTHASSGFETENFSTPPSVTSGTTYAPFAVFSGAPILFFYRDAGTSGDSKFENDNNYTTPTNPSSLSNSSFKYSIYATYTASGGSDPTPLRMLMGMGT